MHLELNFSTWLIYTVAFLYVDSAQNSPRLLVKNKLTPKNPPINKIVVVTEGVSENNDDLHLNNLLSIPICYPLVPINGNSASNCQADLNLYRLNPKHLAELCLRYQEHLRLCSERTTSEQNAMCSRIKEVKKRLLFKHNSWPTNATTKLYYFEY